MKIKNCNNFDYIKLCRYTLRNFKSINNIYFLEQKKLFEEKKKKQVFLLYYTKKQNIHINITTNLYM